MIGLLDVAFDRFSADLYERIAAAGFGDVRPGHGCVFGTIEPEGSRLTDLAERARMTKQTVGRSDDRPRAAGLRRARPDPRDGRAKIIRLTARGREAQSVGRKLIEETETRLGRALRRGDDALAARCPRGHHWDWFAAMFPG